MTEQIGIVEIGRLKVIGTDPRTLVQVLGAVFLVLFPQLGPVAKVDPLLAHFCITRKPKIGSRIGLVQELPVPAPHDQTVTSGHLPHFDPTTLNSMYSSSPTTTTLAQKLRVGMEKPALLVPATPRNFR